MGKRVTQVVDNPRMSRCTHNHGDENVKNGWWSFSRKTVVKCNSLCNSEISYTSFSAVMPVMIFAATSLWNFPTRLFTYSEHAAKESSSVQMETFLRDILWPDQLHGVIEIVAETNFNELLRTSRNSLEAKSIPTCSSTIRIELFSVNNIFFHVQSTFWNWPLWFH